MLNVYFGLLRRVGQQRICKAFLGCGKIVKKVFQIFASNRFSFLGDNNLFSYF